MMYTSGNLKRVVDVVMAAAGLVLALPLILLCAAAVFLADRRNPFYVARRVGKEGRTFRLFKVRTMVVGAETCGVDTTAADDPRLLRIGRAIRSFKLDELPQLVNVLVGDMSFVGPRPNVEREVARYTAVERELLSVKPGITDFSSIVFADLAALIPENSDANLAYNQYVRPWKSRLGLHYVRRASLKIDFALLLLTLCNPIARRWVLCETSRLLARTGAAPELSSLALRESALAPSAPPGASRIVMQEDLCKRGSGT